MFIKLCKRRGQNTAEYAILIGVIVAAAIAMQVYVRRGMQARIKQGTDYSKEACMTIFTLGQYEPYYTCSTFMTNQGSSSAENLLSAGAVNRVSNETTNRTGSQNYTSYLGGT